MSGMKCTTCPQPKKIGFLIVSEGEAASGIPEDFGEDALVKRSQLPGEGPWQVKAQGETLHLQALQKKKKNSTETEKSEICRQEKRETRGWLKEDFHWLSIDSDQADLLLDRSIFRYVNVGEHLEAGKTSPK